MPGPVRVCPFRSRTTLSTWMTNASPGQVRSFASLRSPVTCVLHFASFGATVRAGALVAFGDAGTGVEAPGTGVPGVEVAVVTGTAGWQATTRTASRARPMAPCRMFEGYTSTPRARFPARLAG